MNSKLASCDFEKEKNRGSIPEKQGDELQYMIVKDALQQSQHHQFVHADEHEKVLAKLRENEERILDLEAEVRMLKDGEPRGRSNIEPENQYGGCSTLGGHDASPLHQTSLTGMYADMGGVGLLSSSREHARDANIDPAAVMAGGPEEAHDEVHTGEEHVEGASKATSSIATGIKDQLRMRTQSVRLQSPFTMTYARKHKMTPKE